MSLWLSQHSLVEWWAWTTRRRKQGSPDPIHRLAFGECSFILRAVYCIVVLKMHLHTIANIPTVLCTQNPWTCAGQSLFNCVHFSGGGVFITLCLPFLQLLLWEWVTCRSTNWFLFFFQSNPVQLLLPYSAATAQEGRRSLISPKKRLQRVSLANSQTQDSWRIFVECFTPYFAFAYTSLITVPFNEIVLTTN